MTTPRDPDTRLRAYLDDGPTELPIRSYEAVDARIARTRQRVVFGPRRDLRMPNLSRAVSIAAAAILVTLALAIATAGPGGSPAPSAVPPPSTSPSLTPAATPSPSPTPAIYRWPGALAAGTYDTNMAWGQELVFHFTVGDGWQAQDINIATASYRSGLWLFPIANVAAVPCTATMTNPSVADPNGVLAALARACHVRSAACRGRVRRPHRGIRRVHGRSADRLRGRPVQAVQAAAGHLPAGPMWWRRPGHDGPRIRRRPTPLAPVADGRRPAGRRGRGDLEGRRDSCRARGAAGRDRLVPAGYAAGHAGATAVIERLTERF